MRLLAETHQDGLYPRQGTNRVALSRGKTHVPAIATQKATQPQRNAIHCRVMPTLLRLPPRGRACRQRSGRPFLPLSVLVGGSGRLSTSTVSTMPLVAQITATQPSRSPVGLQNHQKTKSHPPAVLPREAASRAPLGVRRHRAARVAKGRLGSGWACEPPYRHTDYLG